MRGPNRGPMQRATDQRESATETVNRYRVAKKLATSLALAGVSVERAEQFGDEQWELTAAAVGKGHPSLPTRALAIEILRDAEVTA